MDKDIEEYAQTCQKYNERKTFVKDKAPVHMEITMPLKKPFQKVH